jgi:hypothetical protein
MLFFIVTAVIFLISFLLALRSLKSLNEKPKMGDVKKSLDKHRIIYHSHSSG